MLNLSEINDVCKLKLKQLANNDLIEKIILTKEETQQVGESLKKLFQYDFSWDTIYLHKEIIAVFLVNCAKYYYNDGEGGFWKNVEELTGLNSNKRIGLINAFNIVLHFYDLNKFENIREESYKKIGPIIAHSGLPENLIEGFLNNLEFLLNQDISYNELSEEALYYFRFASINVYRYLTLLNDSGLLNDFLWEVMEIVKNQPTEVDENSNISAYFQNKIIEWNKKRVKQNVNYKYSKIPYLQLDLNTYNICINLPELFLKYDHICIS